MSADSVSPREQLAAAFEKHADRDGMMGWLQFEDAVRELFAAPAAQQPPPPRELMFTLREAQQLVGTFGGEDAMVTVRQLPEGAIEDDSGEGSKSSPGLWAHFTEHPDEGCLYLGPCEVEDAAQQPPLTFQQALEDARAKIAADPGERFCPHCNPCFHDGGAKCREPYGDDGVKWVAQQPVADAPPKIAEAFEKHADRDGAMGYLQFRDAVNELLSARVADARADALRKRLREADSVHQTLMGDIDAYLAQLPAHQNLTGEAGPLDLNWHPETKHNL